MRFLFSDCIYPLRIPDSSQHFFLFSKVLFAGLVCFNDSRVTFPLICFILAVAAFHLGLVASFILPTRLLPHMHLAERCAPACLYMSMQLLGCLGPGTNSYVTSAIIVLVASDPRLAFSAQASTICMICGCLRLLALGIIQGENCAGEFEAMCLALFCIEVVKETRTAGNSSPDGELGVRLHKQETPSQELTVKVTTPLFCVGHDLSAVFLNEPAERLLARCGLGSFAELAEATTVLATNMSLHSYLRSLQTDRAFPFEDLALAQQCLIIKCGRCPKGGKTQVNLHATAYITRSQFAGSLLLSLVLNKAKNDEKGVELASSRTRLCMLTNLAKDISKTYQEGCDKIAEFETTFHGALAGRKMVVALRQALQTTQIKAENVQDFSRILEGEIVVEKTVFDLAAFVGELKELVSATCCSDSNVRLAVSISRNLPSQLFGDKQRLLRVLLSLVSVLLQGSYRATISLTISYATVTQEIELEIKDKQATTSPHMLQEFRRALQCEQGYDATENLEPASLELFTVSYIAAQMGSQIELESADGEGTRFAFWIRQPKKAPRDRLMYFSSHENLHRPRARSRGLSTFGREAQTKSMSKDRGARKSCEQYTTEEIATEDVPEEKIEARVNAPRPSRGWRNIAGIEASQKEARTKSRHLSFLAPPGADAGPRNILVVDDSSVNKFVMRGLFEKLGMQVKEASDGLEGSRLAAEDRFSCIFMDIDMPIMNGIAATRRIREYEAKHALKAVPIVAVTALDDQKIVACCYKAGMSEVLLRPLSLSVLKDCVNRHPR